MILSLPTHPRAHYMSVVLSFMPKLVLHTIAIVFICVLGLLLRNVWVYMVCDLLCFLVCSIQEFANCLCYVFQIGKSSILFYIGYREYKSCYVTFAIFEFDKVPPRFLLLRIRFSFGFTLHVEILYWIFRMLWISWNGFGWSGDLCSRLFIVEMVLVGLAFFCLSN